MRIFKLLNIIFSGVFISGVFLNLTGCSYLNFDSENQAPVSNINTIGASYYTVQDGDTIEGISDGFGVSIGDLALWNKLSPPYSLSSGQRLRVKGLSEAEKSAERNNEENSGHHAALLSSMEPGLVMPSENNASVQRVQFAHPAHPTQAIQSNQANQANQANQSIQSRSVVRSVSPSDKAPVKINPNAYYLPELSQTGWMWPLAGHVSPDSAGGIDIDSKVHNANVVAAKAGKVIYAGPDVSGDGKLVILDNSDGYLSAYGNLESISSQIQEGSALARADSIGKVRSVLHFDIRQSGVSLDPEKYLP